MWSTGYPTDALLTARDKHATILLSVISRDSLLRKLRFLVTVAFPSAEYMIECYQLSDGRKLPLYYFLSYEAEQRGDKDR